MRILSKTWLQAWSTLHNLELKVDYPDNMKKVVDNVMERYRKEKIPIEKLELSQYHNDSHEVFPLIDKWLDIALQNGVKYLIFRVSKFSLPIFTILAAKSLRELVVWGCTLMPVSLSSCVVMNCNSLRKLSLSFVTLDESIIQTLLNSCPLIVSFILKFCSGLEKIELRNLQKIKSVFIRICKNQRVKIEAPTLEVSYFGLLKGLDVTECQNLKSLDLTNVIISDGFLQKFISRSQFLESLILDDLSDVWERFNTCKSQSLKIRNCDGIKEIDATNLISIEYQGKQTPELKIARESCHQKHSKIILSCFRLDSALFGKLRKFLSNSASWSQVSLYLHDCTKINMNDLLLHDRVSIPQVDVLDLKIESYQEFPAFVDVLLLSCHPRRLNLSSYVKINKCFIDRLMYSSHSTSHGRES
ncbi:hypothetical protein CQW23_22665 [Capsicum baccatum]|uniref:At1g61320/AtMIF1 LRR domain-containing protein n=1 Tax=Capsicum baccatum TaxID=33114 RepID=A0A2G2W1I6_CAPBA|nr:hypothetical protein CQW23_22665 [Capsicum baccatum]